VIDYDRMVTQCLIEQAGVDVDIKFSCQSCCIK
jgi:hypothetical protein